VPWRGVPRSDCSDCEGVASRDGAASLPEDKAGELLAVSVSWRSACAAMATLPSLVMIRVKECPFSSRRQIGISALALTSRRSPFSINAVASLIAALSVMPSGGTPAPSSRSAASDKNVRWALVNFVAGEFGAAGFRVAVFSVVSFVIVASWRLTRASSPRHRPNPGQARASLFLLTNHRRARPVSTPKIAYTYLP
jgi:hypothetical protein